VKCCTCGCTTKGPQQVIEGLYNSYSKLIAAAQRRYRRNSSKRGFLELGPPITLRPEEAQAELKDLLENRFKTFFQHDDDAVLPLTGGAKWQELETTGPTARGSVEGRTFGSSSTMSSISRL